VVLAGRGGLSRLASLEEVKYRNNLDPMKNWEDCQRMAELHYNLAFKKEEAGHLIEKYHGDLQQIDMALKVFKDFPHLVDKIFQDGGT
jgi:hypothetical protein